MNTQKAYHAFPIQDVLQEFHADVNGLTLKEVEKRKAVYGLNQLHEVQKASILSLVLHQLKSVLILILLVAAGISFFLHHVTDAFIILAAVVLNVIVGFIQEYKAENALQALRRVVTDEATVLREGHERLIPARELVPGDVLIVNAGERISADARLVTSEELEVNEAALTGESNTVRKQINPVDPSSVVGDRTNMIFEGTTVQRGSGMAVVVATGVRTEIGRIAELLAVPSRMTPLQEMLNRFAYQIGVIVCVVAAGVVGIGMWKGLPFIDIFITSVAIAVSAIPEGLAVSVTVILAIGMQRVLKRNGLVRNLQAAETLGSTSVICTDKTGTLTEGKMQVVSLVTHDYHFKDLHQRGQHEKEGLSELLFALRIGVLCNDAHVVKTDGAVQEINVIGNLTEQALLLAGMHIGLEKEQVLAEEPRLSLIPFDSRHKFMATLHEHPKQGRHLYVKGAPERILKSSTHIRVGSHEMRLSPSVRKEFEAKCFEYSAAGLRTLALAYKRMPKTNATVHMDDCAGLTFVGFVAIQDPLRADIQQTVQKTAMAGIRTVMITGDHKETAKAIARQIGMVLTDQNVLDGEHLHKMTQEELAKKVDDVMVYARVSPEDKLNIIQAWQSRGKVVAMTGDGVNDAPALKFADIGIALGSGTEVAKEASDMILLDNQYATIVNAVDEGRGIFDNIRKVVLYLISDSFSEMILVIVALLVGLPLPITAAQILWINLVADGLPNIALTVDPKEKDTMTRPARDPREPILNRKMMLLTITLSLVTALWNLFIFWYLLRTTGNLDLARSVVFASLAMDSLLYVFSVRSLYHSIFSRNFFSNPWLFVAVVVSFIVQLSAFYLPPLQKVLHTVPLGLNEWGIVLGTSIGVVALFELMKYIFFIRKAKKARS